MQLLGKAMAVYEANLICIATMLNGWQAHNSTSLEESALVTLPPDGSTMLRGHISFSPGSGERVLSYILPALFLTHGFVMDNLYHLSTMAPLTTLVL